MELAYGGETLDYLEELYGRYLADPGSVAPDVARYFAGLGDRPAGPIAPSLKPRSIFAPARAAAPQAAEPAAPEDEPPLEFEVPETLSTPAQRAKVLGQVPLFRELSAGQLRMLAEAALEVACADGQLLIREGALDDAMYIVVEGQVVISKDGRVLAEVGPGGVIGEMTALDQHPRSADGRVSGETRLLQLTGEDLLDAVDDEPEVAFALLKNLSRRLRSKNAKQDAVDQLIRSYRVRGHLLADLDPLGERKERSPELELDFYGLGEADLETRFSSTAILGTQEMTLREILALLERVYCGSIGVQYMHIDDPEAKRWIQGRMEDINAVRHLSREEQLRTLTKLSDAETLERFIHTKFLGAKRFSLEGAETMIPLLDLAIEEAADHGVDEVVFGMPHRGRLNVLANILGKDPRAIFREFDDADAHLMHGTGDVKYHLGFSTDVETGSGKSVHMSLTFNPSHLEFVGPVVAGRVRAKQDRKHDASRERVLGVVLHGDAAIAGQGVVQELLNLSELPGYRSGGMLHLVVNNQIGFTTTPQESRSTQYATDVAKMLQTPVFHVNGEHPEAVAQVVRWAMAYRARFRKDVIIDMYGYRRHGHNEGDEPAFTQPQLYDKVRARKSVVAAYTEHLLRLGDVTREEAEGIARASRERLEAALTQARAEDAEPLRSDMGHGIWQGYVGGAEADVPRPPTAVPAERLRALLARACAVPEGFNVHPKLAKLLERRLAMGAGERPLDWATGELLAFASLLDEGYPLRLSGQDSQRGTFSHRHAVLHDVEVERRYTPLANVGDAQGRFNVYNSPLSEIAVLGFDYGYSLDTPEGLTIWEAQFGDFCNVAQVIIDQFISSAEDKWDRLSGLVLLLPHGFEGQGPEHSSARLERFLALAAEDNMFVVNLTTPAQLFHCLRRQVLRPLRKPLVVMSPKSLLRHPRAVSPLEELASGSFQRVLADGVAPEGVRRVLLCSGKLAIELDEAREQAGREDVSVLRLEQLYPLPAPELEAALARYPAEAELFWVQEEPLNMGAWSFLKVREAALPRPLAGVISRPESASPATGSPTAHKQEQASLISRALGS